MPERLGIVSRYHRAEVTNAALHLAEFTKTRGMPVTFLARDVCRREVAGEWDNKVVDERNHPFHTWAETCNHIVWTAVPNDISEIDAARVCGINTSLLVDWELLRPIDEPTVQAMDSLIIPYRCVGQALQKHWQLPQIRTAVMPWDVSVPITSRSGIPAKRTGVCAYFPLYDSQPNRSDQAVFRLMRKALMEVKDATVMVGCGQCWSISSRRLIKQLLRDFGDRVELVRQPNILQRLILFAKADLTVWLPRFESFAMIGLTSLCMGTPVLSWDVRPQNEYLVAWKNAVLAPCKTNMNWLGVPEVMDGYAECSDMLVAALQDKALLAKLRQSATTGLVSRREQFTAGWVELLK